MFGSLTVDEVIESADTALAVATQSVFGQFGFIMTSIAALFATVGAVNSQLYASIGATYTMAKDGALPPRFGERRRGGTARSQRPVVLGGPHPADGEPVRRQRDRVRR